MNFIRDFVPEREVDELNNVVTFNQPLNPPPAKEALKINADAVS
jgi:hypothetical protein